MKEAMLDRLSAGSSHTGRPPANLVRRVWAEFQEMPGLCLTFAQAQRLFGLEAADCRQVLDALVRVRHLAMRADRYVKRSSGPVTAAASVHSSDWPWTHPANSPRTAGMGLQSAPPRQILVVDDDPDIVRALGLRLRAAGFGVLAAGDGTTAVSMAVRHQPDVVILDIGLPAGDGHAVTKRLRSDGSTAEIPVIFVTARVEKDDFKKAQAAGAVGYFIKPYRADELLNKVHEVLGRAA